MEQPVLQARALNLHIVGKLEATLEVPRGDTLIEQAASLLVIGLLLAAGTSARIMSMPPAVALIGKSRGRMPTRRVSRKSALATHISRRSRIR